MATRQQLKDELKKQLKEMSSSGAAGAYSTPYAFNPNKKAQGTSRNYYLKMGWKPVNKEQMRKQAKGMEYKDLWK
jgi:hypothetical protein